MTFPSRPTLLSLAIALLAAPAWAEDIDLYTSGNTSLNAPNVLFFVDNSSNWSANNQAWTKAGVLTKCGTDTTCQNYVSQVFGSDSSLKQGQVEMRALKLVINELVCGTGAKLNINAGVMLYNTAGTVSSNSVTTGYIRHAIKGLDSTYCASLTSDLENIATNITTPDFKGPSSAEYGAPLFEAFKYFGGYTNPANANTGTAGTPASATAFGPIRNSKPTTLEDVAAFTDSGKGTYKSPISSANSCGKNYIVLIGNKFPNQEYGTNQNATPPTNSTLTGLGYSPNQLYNVSNKSSIRFADEWSQFLATTDVSSAAGQQPVYTYTLDIFNGSPDADQGQLLRSMALNGGTGTSGYYQINGDLKSLIDAFKDIFTQIAAVNSVFASASLPVSVNTQGTYLNQVFIGMFRPDGSARPRWAGNLKQYQFAISGSGANTSLFLADKDSKAAVDSANTGFIKACATSFWTTDSGTYWQRVPEAQTPLTACPTLPAGVSVYSDLPDGNIVERGAIAEKLRALTTDTRNIKTCATLACTSLVDFNTTQISSSTLSSTLVNWVRGINVGDGPTDVSGSYQLYKDASGNTPPSPNLMRPTIHGDVVHSRPLAINYGTASNNDVVVFYGSGDGMLRAVDGNQTTSAGGSELWSFVAPEFFAKFNRLRENEPKIKYPTVSSTETPTPIPKDYFFDGSISAYQERDANDNITKLHLYASMRRGGRTLYAFNVTNRPSSSANPTLLWKYGCPNDGDDNNCTTARGSNVTKIGQTWSTPHILRVKGAASNYVVFGGGYDKCEDDETTLCGSTTKGQGIFILNAENGNEVAYIDLTSVNSAAGRVIADISAIDVNGDGYTDVLYAVDTRGNVWRTNLSNPSNGYTGYDATQWQTNTYRLAKVSDWSSYGTQSRKFMYAPDVVTLGALNMVLVGSGDREQPLDTSKAAKVLNRFYGFKDFYASAIATTTNGLDCDTKGNTTLDTGCDLVNTTSTSIGGVTPDYRTALVSSKGWYIELDSTVTSPTEQVVTTPVTTGGYTYFSTFQATDHTSPSATCSNLGTGRGYAVNFLDGSLRAGDGIRSATFAGGGIPPSAVAGVVQIGDNKYPFLIGGRPNDSGGSALDPQKVKLNIITKRKQVYRYQNIDK